MASGGSSGRSPYGSVLQLLTTLSLLAFFSLWGLLTREGLVALNTYHGQSIQPLIWAQAVGCLVMGWALANKGDVDRVSPQLYVGITTGFCGSVTTFSSWVLQVFEAFSNRNREPRGGIYSVMDALTQTGTTIGMSLIALRAGRAAGETFLSCKNLAALVTHPVNFMRRLSPSIENGISLQKRGEDKQLEEAEDEVEVPAPSRAARETSLSSTSKALSVLLLLLGPLFWIGTALLFALYPPFRLVTFPMLLSPPGAILRWWLALKLNTRFTSPPASVQDKKGRLKGFPRWPVGTLAANLLAAAVISGAFTAQHVGLSSSAGTLPAVRCQALYGLQEGFCGCLSTISTFAVELESLRPRRKAFAYLLASWLLGVLLCLCLVGIPTWTRGYEGRCEGITY